jgi:zinc protease
MKRQGTGKILCGWIFPLAVLAATAPQAATRVDEFQLDNGLKIFVKEDHRAPVVVSQIWYRVGSSYESPGITGISHALEHMMFQGTERVPAGRFAKIVAENGGSQNAFTGQDYTAYFQRLERSRLEVSFELEADRMRNLVLDAGEFAREIDVVKEERRLRTEDNPRALTLERFNATAFLTSPYRNPVVGWMWDLDGLSVQDLRKWYQRWYVPNNASLVVVGDVDPLEVYRLAHKHFGPLRPSEPAKPLDTPEVEQRGLRQIIVRAPAKVPFLVMGYKVPSLGDADQKWEAYALEVLDGILDGGGSARLTRELVRGSQVAAGAGAEYALHSRRSGLFLFSATPAPGRSVQEVEAGLKKAIHELQTQPVTDKELARVKAQVVADAVYELDSNFYQAMKIGLLETLGLGWRTMDEYVDGVSAVTAQQVQAVARKYLIEDQMTVAHLDPLPLQAKASATQNGKGGRHSVSMQ